MKKIFAYFLPVIVFSVFLCACGRDRVDDNTVLNTPVVSPTITMTPSASPSMVPDMSNGDVNDTDGIITESDNGNSTGNLVPGTSSPAPSASAKP